MRLTRRQVIVAAGIAVCAGVGAVTWALQSEPEPATTRVAWADVRLTAALPGRAEAAVHYRLYFGATLVSPPGAEQPSDDACALVTYDPNQARPGPVVSVTAEVGAAVTAGQELAKADTTAAVAELASAQQDLEQAQRRLDQDQALALQAASGPSPEARQDTQVAAGSAVGADQDRVTQINLRVTQARKTLADARITAPADGVIQAVDTALGSSPACRTPAFQLRSTALQVVADVPGSLLSRLAVGQHVVVALPQLDRSASTSVTSTPVKAVVSPQAVPSPYAAPGAQPAASKPVYPLAVTLDKPPAGMVPGMPAELTIVLAERRHVLAVPNSAVHHKADGDYVTLVSSVVKRCHDCSVRVSTGLVGDSLTEITDGVLLGDTIAVPGSAASTPTPTYPSSSASPPPSASPAPTEAPATPLPSPSLPPLPSAVPETTSRGADPQSP
ncbi:efflux RND transporter periplasmic adaptor subunit [Kitasatospora atroaurantiaca]|uniref:efflux RND transporter periplasmic adaptor subunit n=1 Tax=Kitasatospora atroaurantiaca TaxID=285545 RepID=UPI0011A115CA|nr:efflux RND transporter periplasmic adaptor subunit [Kitasatospora atroaurantiaca]